MSTQIINGKQIAQDIRENLKVEIEQLKAEGIQPGLAVVLVGDDPASNVYVNHKSKTCGQLGMYSEVHRMAHDTSQEQLLQRIAQLNADPRIHGILVQLPLPDHISDMAVISAIDVRKDVDGFHPVNVGRMLIGEEAMLPCTPAGIIEMIKLTTDQIAGKHAVVIGRSNIVGKPISMLLLQENATVTMCHSRTENLQHMTRQADILIVATGRAKMITKEYVKPGSVVIDVGINRLADGTLAGDVHYDEVKEIAGFITPVPGGVGPMTIVMLMKNTIAAAKNMMSAQNSNKAAN